MCGHQGAAGRSREALLATGTSLEELGGAGGTLGPGAGGHARYPKPRPLPRATPRRWPLPPLWPRPQPRPSPGRVSRRDDVSGSAARGAACPPWRRPWPISTTRTWGTSTTVREGPGGAGPALGLGGGAAAVGLGPRRPEAGVCPGPSCPVPAPSPLPAPPVPRSPPHPRPRSELQRSWCPAGGGSGRCAAAAPLIPARFRSRRGAPHEAASPGAHAQPGAALRPLQENDRKPRVSPAGPGRGTGGHTEGSESGRFQTELPGWFRGRPGG